MRSEKLKWYGVIFALFILFLYGMGIYDIFMMLSHNIAYYESKGYGQLVVEYFTNYPIWLLVFWIFNLACGFIAPILYIIKNKYACYTAMVSFVCDAVLIVLGAIFRNRLEVLGFNVFCFDMFILIITFLFAVFLYWERKKWQKSNK